MKVTFISPVTPYRENMGGPSGHPYHLMIERPSGIGVTVYTFNQNLLSAETISEVEKELDIKIKVIRPPWWYKLVFRLHLTFIRLLLKFPINYYIRLPKGVVTEIRKSQPDLIWGYCQEFSGILSQFKEFKRLHTVPDSYCLHWYRRLGRPLTLSHNSEYFKVVLNYKKYYRMEHAYDSSDNNLELEIRAAILNAEAKESVDILNNLPFDFGSAISYLRERKKMSVEDLEASALISQRTIYSLQKNAKEPKLQTIVALCIALTLPYPVSVKLMEIAGRSLRQSSIEEMIYAEFLQKSYELSVEDCNQMLTNLNYSILTTKTTL